jgi:hypothetical protein
VNGWVQGCPVQTVEKFKDCQGEDEAARVLSQGLFAKDYWNQD